MRIKISIVLLLLISTLTISTVIGINRDIEGLDFNLLSSDKVIFSAPALFYEESDSQIYDNSISGFNTLLNSSDIILRVTAGPNSQPRGIMQNESTITKLLTKSDNLNVNDKITIFEPVVKGRRNVLSDCAFLPMIEGKEYYVFLKNIDTFIGHKTFNFSSALFGKIPVDQNINILDVVYTDDLIVDYSYLKNSDFVLFDTSNLLLQYSEELLKDPGNTYFIELSNSLKKYNEYKEQLVSIVLKVQNDFSGQKPIFKYQLYPWKKMLNTIDCEFDKLL